MIGRLLAFLVRVSTLLVLGVGTAGAQTLLGTDAGEVWHGTSAGAHAGAWLDTGEVGTGDTRRDLIIGSPGVASNRGSVYVVFGGPTRSGDVSLSSATVTITGLASGDLFGTRTAAGFILSSERTVPTGRRDLLVSAPGAFGGRGSVYLFRGGFANGAAVTANAAIFQVIGAPGDGLGSALATADLNSDGYRELVIGAANSGRVYIIPGGPSLAGTYDLSVQQTITMTGSGIGNVLAAGDMTGDGVYDLAIGSPSASGGTGEVYLIAGRTTGELPMSRVLPDGADARFSGVGAGGQFGSAVIIADFDTDKYGDLIVGAPGASGAGGARAGSGAVYVFWGNSAPVSRPATDADVIISGSSAGDRAGASLAAADINRQFPDDILLLAPGASPGGDIYAYYGRSRSGIPHAIDLATQANKHFIGDPAAGPIAVVTLFDTTGEGAEDIVASVPTADGLGGIAAGRVYVAYSPRLSVSSASIALTVIQGGTVNGSVDVRNTGGGALDWAARSNSSVLSISPASGSATAALSSRITVTASAAGLAAGVYHGSVSVGSRTFDLDMTTAVAVDLTVTPAPPGTPPPPPPNVFGLPTPPDQGSPLGVMTPAGTQVAVLPLPDVMVVFSKVITPGNTLVEVTSNGTDQTGLSVKMGPWVYRVSTTAAFSGAVTIAVLYDPTLVGWEGATRLMSNTRDLTTQLDVVRHVVYGTSNSLPLTVANAENVAAYSTGADPIFNYIGSTWETNWRVYPMKLNSDSAADLFLYAPSSGLWRQSLNNGRGAFNIESRGWSAGWNVYPATLNRDTYQDVFLYNPTNGLWFQCLNDGQGGFTYVGSGWSTGWDVSPADLDGDGLTDLFLYNQQSGLWFKVMNRGDGTFRYVPGAWDPGWKIYPADLNGDRRTDLFMYKPNTGQWFEVFSGSGDSFSYVGGWWSTGWTVTIGDYDGDGLQDVFVYNVATGGWYECFSVPGGGFTYSGGAWDPGWQVSAANFNADGKTDLFLYKPAVGTWFRTLSVSRGQFQYSGSWWSPGWQVFVADLNGDGKDDVFLYRPSDGKFFDVITK